MNRTLATLLVMAAALVSLAPAANAINPDCQRFAIVGDPSGGGVVCYEAGPGGVGLTGRATLCFDNGECYWILTGTFAGAGSQSTGTLVCHRDAAGNVTCNNLP